MYYQRDEGNPAFCFNNNAVDKIFRDIGNEEAYVGYLADEYPSIDLLGFEKFLVLWSSNKAKINSFFVSPPKFFKSLDQYNTLIYISSTEQEWPEFEGFIHSIEFFCRENNIELIWDEFLPTQFNGKKLIISKGEIHELLNIRKHFIKTNQIRFFTQYSLTGPSVNIYVFKRIKVDSKKYRNNKNLF